MRKITLICASLFVGVSLSNAQFVTFAGSPSSGILNGTGTTALFHNPTGITADKSGNLYVADQVNNVIRKIVISTGQVTTLAGTGSMGQVNGAGTAASFNQPVGVAADTNGNLYVADAGNNVIRKIVIASATVSTLPGNGGQGS